ncbi:zinc-dependent metalloprotease [soil metagenome]|jgi:putative hydrolase
MSDPFGGGFDPRMFEQVPLFRELQKVMSWTGGPVNWDLAGQTAMAIATDADTRATSDRDVEELAQAVHTAELWLDQVTDLPGIDGPVRAFTQEQWVREAARHEGLGAYVEPVAQQMGAALSQQLPEELAGMAGAGGPGNPFAQAMQSMGAMLYGMQTGTIAGHLAGQLLGAYGLGVPTIDARIVGTVGGTADRFARDYDFDAVEFRHWLALSEAAHRRMFAGVSWLSEHVAGLVRRFAADAEFDPGSLFDQLGGAGLDPSDPTSMQRALESPDAFRIEPTSAQRATLGRLQALISFTEAWVDTVIESAAGDKLTALPRISEALRRRRAEHGPGEQFLQQLVGLDLSPADVRQAQAFCAAVIAARGQEGLDRVWRDATHLPDPQELGEPSRWLVRMAAAELTDGSE